MKPRLEPKDEHICTFTYTDKFHNVSPSWISLLGYSSEELSGMKLENFLVEGSGKELLQTMANASLPNAGSGNAQGKVAIKSCGGYTVLGMFYIEWSGGKNNIFYCSFVYSQKEAVIEDNMIYGYISEISMSGLIKYNEYSDILYVDRVFETYFDIRDAVDKKTYSFSSNKDFATFLKFASETEDCFCMTLGEDKILAVIDKKESVVTVRVYGKNYLLKARSMDDLSVILSRKRIWDKLPMMFLIDVESRSVVDANPAASEFYGFRIDEFKNMPLSNISMLPKDILEQELGLACSGKKTFFISRHRIANGQVKDVNYTTSVISVGERKYIIAFITDITRRKNLEKVIEEKNTVLTELNMSLSKMVQEGQKENKKKEEMFLRQSKLAAVGEMVSSIAGYWQEPLNTIGLLVQDMEDADKYGELDDAYIADMVKKVMSHLQNISGSIDTCVKFFKNDNEEEMFDVRNSVLGIVKVLDHRFSNSKVTICVDCVCTVACLGFDENGACLGGRIDILGRVNEFKHALCNILINSLDSILNARKTGVLLNDDEGLIFINIKTDDKKVSISISDNGGGIDEEKIPKVFDPYYSTKESGMGIGLYITKQLVEKNMRGVIDFENIREGCMVTVTLPCAQDKVINA